jgi:hypothetical protein
VWKVPLLGTLSLHVRQNTLTHSSSPDTASHTDDRYSIVGLVIIIFMGRVKVVARQSIGATMSDFLMSKTIHLPSFRTCEKPSSRTFVTRSCLMVVPSADRRLRCFERVLKGCYRCCAIGRGGTSTFSGGDLEKDVGQVRGDRHGGGSMRQCRRTARTSVHGFAPFTQESGWSLVIL